MLKSKNIVKHSHLLVDDTQRQSSKLTKKKPRYQHIIRSLKAQIQELQRQIQQQEDEKDRQIRRLNLVISQQSIKIKQLQAENNKITTRLKNCSQKLGQLQSNRITFTIGNTQKKGSSSSARKQKEPSVKMTDRTPRKHKNSQRQGLNHPVFSKSTMDMFLHASPHRFNLSSQMDDIPLVNVFNTEEKGEISKKRSNISKIICRSLKNEYKSHKCNSRCDFKDQLL